MNIFGKGGHAKVVINSAKEIDIVCDDSDFSNYELNDKPWIIAIGDNAVREKISLRFDNFKSVIARSAVINTEHNSIGDGTFIADGAVIQPGVKIGMHSIINTNANVDHDCIIGNYVHIAPGTTLCGWVHIGDGTIIGAGSVVLPSVKVGKNCVIGAGSVVNKDIPDNSKAYGNPAKIK